MKKLSISIFFVIITLFGYQVAFGAPTSTTVQNLFISALGGTGTKCLHILNSGLASTTSADCGVGSGGGIASSSRSDAQYTQGNLFIVINSSTAIAFDNARYESSTNTFTVGTVNVTKVAIGASSLQNDGAGDLIFRSGGGNFYYSDFQNIYLGNDQGTTTVSNRNRNGNLCIGTEANGNHFCFDGASTTRLGIFEADNGRTFYFNTSNLTNGVTLTPPSVSGTLPVGTGTNGSCTTWTGTSTLASTTCATGGGGIASSSPIFLHAIPIFINSSTVTTNQNFSFTTSSMNLMVPTGTFSGRIVVPEVYGSTATSSNLNIYSTSNATKGRVIFNDVPTYPIVVDSNVFGTSRMIVGGTRDWSDPLIAPGGALTFLVESEQLALFSAWQSSNNSDGPAFFGFKTRGTLGTSTSPLMNDNLLSIIGTGLTASNTLPGKFPAQINFVVDGSPTSDNMPARMEFIVVNEAGEDVQRITVKNNGNVGFSTPSPSSTVHVNGNFQMSASSSVVTPSIGGGLLAAGACASATSSIDTTVVSSTAAFVTSPRGFYPGDGTSWFSYLSAPGFITTKVCAIVTVTPTATDFNVKIIK